MYSGLATFYWKVFAGHHRWLRRFNGEDEYPHLLALLVIGLTAYFNIVTVVSLAVLITGWQLGGWWTRTAAVALLVLLVAALASYSLSSRRYEQVLFFQVAVAAKRNQRLALAYTLGSIAILVATFAAHTVKNSAGA